MISKNSLCLAALVVFLASSAQAQIEAIGPITLGPGQSANLVFTNLMPPDPDFKELQFIGIANTVPGALGNLLIEFDYIDLQGLPVIVPAPNSMFLVLGGQPNPLDTGILTLPFCPQIVSLHLTNIGNASSVPIDVIGSFRHECVPVPEPGSLVLAGLGAMGLCLLGRKFRRRK